MRTVAYDVQVFVVLLLGAALVQGAVVGGVTVPLAVQVVRHHVGEVHPPASPHGKYTHRNICFHLVFCSLINKLRFPDRLRRTQCNVQTHVKSHTGQGKNIFY